MAAFPSDSMKMHPVIIWITVVNLSTQTKMLQCPQDDNTAHYTKPTTPKFQIHIHQSREKYREEWLTKVMI